jgi:hypothetical protein
MGSLMTDMIFSFVQLELTARAELALSGTGFHTRKDEARSVTTGLGSGEARPHRAATKLAAALGRLVGRRGFGGAVAEAAATPQAWRRGARGPIGAIEYRAGPVDGMAPPRCIRFESVCPAEFSPNQGQGEDIIIHGSPPRFAPPGDGMVNQGRLTDRGHVPVIHPPAAGELPNFKNLRQNRISGSDGGSTRVAVHLAL